MTKEQAIKILIEHNKWRLGAEIQMQDPKEITAAINLAIEILKTTHLTKKLNKFNCCVQ